MKDPLMEICTKCLEDGYHCRCENYHPTVKPHELILGRLGPLDVPLHYEPIEGLWLTIQELKAIYRILEHEYISYEDLEARAVLNKISKIFQGDKL